MELRYILKTLLLPPCSQLLMLLAAWWLRRVLPKTARLFYILAILSLWALSTPAVATLLALSLTQDPPIPKEQLVTVSADAIVILSGGQNEAAFEFGEPVSRADSLMRLRYGAFLGKRTGLPILLSGGSVLGDEQRTLAETMAFDLREGFGLEAKWLEKKSRTTAENAEYSFAMLQAEKITTIFLVTSSYHMKRAKWCFEQEGFRVLPAATDFIEVSPLSLRSFLPNAHSLHVSRDVIHEWLGYWVYRFAG